MWAELLLFLVAIGFAINELRIVRRDSLLAEEKKRKEEAAKTDSRS